MLLVLEQQVSLASARAAFDRLIETAGTATPEAVLALDDATLRAVGFSRQKASYTRDLAQAVLSGSLDLEALSTLPDDGVRSVLTGLRGIGPWTADVYLTMALLRPDAFPHGDLALLASAQRSSGPTRGPAHSSWSSSPRRGARTALPPRGSSGTRTSASARNRDALGLRRHHRFVQLEALVHGLHRALRLAGGDDA